METIAESIRTGKSILQQNGRYRVVSIVKGIEIQSIIDKSSKVITSFPVF